MKNIRLKSIISLLSLMLFFGFTSSVNAAGPVLDWAKGAGGTGGDTGIHIAKDNIGNTYVMSIFTGTADFDPGEGVSNLTSQAATGVAIVKFDSSGNFIWAKQTGGTEQYPDRGNGMYIDAAGNIYITGGFTGTADFDPGDGTSNLTSAGFNDIYISKLDTDGNFAWVKQIGSTGHDWGVSIIANATNLYITGGYNGTVDFDTGVETTSLTVNVRDEIFVAKYDLDFELVWAKSMGGPSWGDWVQAMTIDSSGNVYTAGTYGYNNTSDFDPGIEEYNLTTVGDEDIFISKLDTNGNFVYAKGMGSTGWDFARDIKLDSSGNIYLTGFFTNTIDFDPGIGVSNYTSFGSSDAYVLKLDSSGNFLWAKQFGGTLDGDDSYTLFFDSLNNIYLGGRFAGTADFDPGVGTYNLTSNGTYDAFLLKLDSSGNFLWAKQFGGTGDDFIINSEIDSNDTIYLTGYFSTTVDFNPNAGTTNLTSNGSTDIFILKLSIDSTAPTFTLNTPTPTDSTSINITWSTNENASSIVEYGTTTNYGSTTAETDTTTGTTTHNVTLSNLTACTTYYYRVKSNDLVSNLAVSSNNTFKTSGCINTSGTSFAGRLMNMLSINKAKEVKSTNDQIVVLGDGEKGKIFVSPLDNQTKSCPGFNQYFRYGSKNDEIKLWQSFLNKEVGTNLSIDGSFGPATKKAVINFQEKYKTEILTPWKLSKGTGYIYQATRFKANELLGCAKPSLTLDNGVTLKK